MNKARLVWFGGGLALGAIAIRGSVARASDPARLVIDKAIDGEPLQTRKRTKPVSRRFDALFEKHGRGLPLAYLRSLGKRESNLNPRDQDGPAWGLLQVVEVVRRDFNKRHRTSYSRRDLLEPRINVSIATDLLRRIIKSYHRNHPSVPNMQLNWENRRFVELLTFGWNAGWSEAGGVGRVAHYLEAKGLAEMITIDTVHEAAKAARASRHLSNARKVAWCKGVAALFRREWSTP